MQSRVVGCSEIIISTRSTRVLGKLNLTQQLVICITDCAGDVGRLEALQLLLFSVLQRVVELYAVISGPGHYQG